MKGIYALARKSSLFYIVAVAAFFFIMINMYLLGESVEGYDPEREPIDVVYTWVNGSDPVLHKLLAEYSHKNITDTIKEEEEENKSRAMDESRFRDWDELRYSVRSVEKFLPWIRKIYIVAANGQQPTWLNPANQRIQMVYHSQIFRNKTHLPTFNSNAIEANIHHIPGLSRRFLYFNDDYFIGRPLKRSDFFKEDGSHYVFLDSKRTQENFVGDRRNEAISYSNTLLNKIMPHSTRKRRRYDSHAPGPMNVQVMEDLENRAQIYFDETSSHRFREPNDVCVVFVYNHYAVENRPGVAEIPSRLWTIRNIYDIGIVDSMLKNHILLTLLRIIKPAMFCLNDDVERDTSVKKVWNLVHDLFESYFPEPSSMEIL